MRPLPFSICLLIAGLLALAACSPPPASDAPRQQTAADLETQIVAIRRSATVAAERLQITVVGARDVLRQVQRNATALQGTLSARGYGAAVVTAPANPNNGAPAAPTLAITPAADRNPASPLPSLSDFRTGTAIGADDCVLEPSQSLAASSAEIYTSTRAQNLPLGAQLGTRWYFAGEERVRLPYTLPFAVGDHCVWFFIEPSDTPFTPGSWTVVWEVDGAPYPALSFQITPN